MREECMSFDRAVFWSGVWNMCLGLVLVVPPIRSLLSVQVPYPFWPAIVAAFLWYTSATLILSSYDVAERASFIYWEALLRFAAVAVLLIYGFEYVGAFPTVLFALTDFAWGIFYIFGLRRVTDRSQLCLLLDRT
jgi:hypothetical protein